eukprot:12962477-Heterocapsa_arctica.AAC.1
MRISLQRYLADVACFAQGEVRDRAKGSGHGAQDMFGSFAGLARSHGVSVLAPGHGSSGTGLLRRWLRVD